MKNHSFFFWIVLLVLISVPFVSATTEGDFVRIDVDGREAYTHKDIVNHRYLLATDKIFYGSSEGTVFVDVFISDRIASGQYKIGLETRKSGITIKSIQLNNRQKENIISTSRVNYVYPTLIDLNSMVTKIRIEIDFDPAQIGLREEFDVVLYDNTGRELLRNDPFLSGFNFRQKITLDTNGIGLGGDVTNDESIWIHILATNTDFWTNHSFVDANGIDFTEADEITLLNWDVEGFDATNDDANIWVNFTPTFSSTFDSNLFIYYGGTNSNNSDGTAAYPSDLNAVYHSNDASGGVVDSTINAVDMTAQNTPTFGVDGQIDSAVDYQAADDDYQKTSNKFTGTSGSIAGWFNFDVDNSNQVVVSGGDEGGGDLFALRVSTDNHIEILTTVSASTDLVHGDTNIVVDTWFHTVVTSNGSTWVLYLNGVAEGLTVEEGSNTGEWWDDVSTIDNSTIAATERVSVITPADGTIDEVRIYTNTLTADEVLILYNSQIDGFISFGAQESDFAANFSFVVTPSALDPGSGINSVNIDLNDTSSIGTKTIQDWNYFIDSVRFYTSTVDGNTTRVQTTAGDFNISFLIMATDSSVSQKDQTVSIGTTAQNVDINFTNNVFDLNTANVNFGVTFDGTATAFNWGFPGDQNQLTQNINKIFSTNARQEVCVTITTTGDVNSTTCEFFNIGRVLTKIPLDITNVSSLLTPFNISVSQLPSQSYSALSSDSNILFFTDSTSFNSTIFVDANADFFSTSRAFLFDSNNLFFEFQPYLTPQAGNLESIITTLSNATQRRTITGIRIESRTDVNGTFTLVESKFSDITGTAAFHFDIGKTYELKFFDTVGSLIFTGILVPKSTDTELFAFLQEAAINVVPTTVGNIIINWIPSTGNLKPVDQNVTVTQILNSFNITIGDVNVIVSSVNDDNVFYSQIFSVNATDVNLTYDINVSSITNSSDLLGIRLDIFDVNGFLIQTSQSVKYTLFPTDIIDGADSIKTGLGTVLSVFMAVLISFIVIALITNGSIGEDLNFIGIGAFLLTGMFVMFGFIEFNTWAFATLLSIGLMLLGRTK